MKVTREYREYALGQLRAVAPLTAKAMFGGVGIYSGEAFFALIADDVLYFKTDETTRGEFVSAGSRAFDPFGKGPGSYYEVPIDVLESQDELRQWARRAIAIARKGKKKK